MKTITLLLTLLYAQVLVAQEIKGTVKDTKQSAIPYVNVGIPAKAFGVTTDELGNFKFKLTTERETDTIYVSAIGYKALQLSVATLKQYNTNNTPIVLTELVYELNAVTVRPNEYETKTLGSTNIAKNECENIAELLTSKDTTKANEYKRKCKAKGMDDKAIGVEVANRIAVKDGQQTFIDKIQFKTCLGVNDTAIYRVNVYKEGNTVKKKMTRVGMVKLVAFENLLKKPILVKTIGKTEVHNIDISQQNIEVTDDFIVGLECIYSSNKQMNIGAEYELFSDTDLFVKKSLNTNWVKFPVLHVTFVSATVTYKKQKSIFKFW
ncbi:MAG: carboxypeptidase-like regulatory domain-containing protein [Bacteroidia bacterium]